MIHEILFPRVSETNDQGKINLWKIKEGQFIRKGLVLLEIESEKAALEIESPVDGYLRKIMASDGAICSSGDLIAILSDSMDDDFPQPRDRTIEKNITKQDQKDNGKKIVDESSKFLHELNPPVSPYARQLIKEFNLDIRKIQGSGPDGRITKADVLPLIGKSSRSVKTLTEKTRIVLSPMRRNIASMVVKNKQTIPHAYVQVEMDMSNALAWKKAFLENKKERNLSISITDLIILAVAVALVDFPLLNASFHDDFISIWEEINIGFVVSLQDEGLIVPVIFEANKKSLNEINQVKTKLLKKIEDHQIQATDLDGGTFSISNLGMLGADAIFPIIYQNQSAILGIGEISKKPVIKENNIQIAESMWTTLAFDHRVTDGETAAKFLNRLKELLAKPEIWLNPEG